MFFSRFLAGAILTSSVISAQNVSYCTGDVCFAVNIPASTASNGSGDIYIQMSGPDTMSWIGIGQGSAMRGANIFVMYADSTGNNVTLSPRLGVGNVEPNSDTSAQVTLLDGSGIINGQMIAKFRCSNCDSWSGGSMSFTDSSSAWIWAHKTGAALSSISVDADIDFHDANGVATLNLQTAIGGESTNPFLTVGFVPTPSQTSSGASGAATGSSKISRVTIAHGVLASLAYVILFPSGAIAIRIFSFRNLLWLHAGWMIGSYIIVLASLGMGVWIAYMCDVLDSTHSIIGLVVAGCLLLQPITGFLHHMLYKRRGGPNVATYPHVWWGRVVITLGIINGGLGLRLADNSKKGEIAYGLIAGFIWVLWVAVILFATVKIGGRRGSGMDGSGASVIREKSSTEGSYFHNNSSPPQSMQGAHDPARLPTSHRI
ncbi:uncharacterized protein EAF01_005296 [Botrytis porri]|uniref:Cytochrome b561 domain-containing protein n=1 Tax=Botrytis porri TaxID=87229 RepID=A0A4Z1L3E8_9HELO|nr:uncharacterized protein EAF01_005296 [Botrytis porri]KAF7907710.1 hypothetical protein EAF01_005296 [Botrytis porri]TGO91344.1 hypothetical protein BPOR_0030g00040 [Botrytis porri]